MVLFIQVGDLGEPHLVARILIFQLIEIVFAPPDNIYWVVAVSGVAAQAIAIYADQIW
jgi:hypothetical protein